MTTYYAKATGGSDAADGLTLATAKTLTGATSACAASGDTIMIAAGTYINPTLPAKTISYQSYTLPTAVTPPGWINPDPALAIRNVIFKGSTTAVGAADCHFHGIHFKFDKWANTMLGEQLSVPGGAIFVQGVGTHAPIFHQCEFSWGYGPNQDPFDPTTANEYPEFQSGAFANEGHSAVGKGDPYQSWWQIRDDGLVGSSPSYQPTPDKVTGLVGTPNGRAYNTIANGPIGFKSLANQRPPQMYECYFHDLAGGVAYSHATGPFVLDNCRFLRIYRDHLAGAIGQYETTIAPNSGLQVSRCLFDSPFGRFDDSGNAHSDVIQNFNNSPIPTPSQPVLIPNIRIERNFMLIREGFRGSGQFMFFQGAQSHLHDLYGAVYVSPLVRDNISIQLDGAVGVTFSYAFDGDFTNNQFLHVPNVGASGNLQIESTVHPTWNGGFGGTPRVAYNMTEGGGSVLGGQFNDNVAVGMNFAAIPFAAAVTGPLLPPTAQAHEYYAAMRPKAAYAGKGPRFNTLEEFLNSPLVDTDVVPFVAYRSKQLQSLHSPMTSTASTIRGPIGGTVDVSVNLGEFQIESVTGSVITPWRSAALTAVPVKSLLRLRHNSADTFGTVTNQQVTLTSAYHTPKVYSFSSTTQANTPWPTLQLSPSAPVDALIFNGVIAEDHVDNNKHTVALWFKPAGIPSSSTQYIIGSSSGSGHPIRAAFLPTGKIRITGRDPTTASVFTQYDSSNAITVGHEYLLIISIDLSLGSDGVTAKGWNMTDGISHLEWGTAAGVVDTKLSLSVSTKHGISGVTGAAGFDFDYLFLHPRKFMNAKLPETAQAFSKAFIGPRGEGPFGSIPAIFVAGPASLVDAAGGSNWGTVGPVVRGAAGFITDVDSPVPAFPPQLIIDASVQEQSPFYDGEPINILLQPRGYAGAHTITATSSRAGVWSNTTTTVAAGTNGVNITFTPSEPGKHIISFTNSLNYINPDPIEILIRDPNASFIIPGTTVKLTKAQAATLKIVTDTDEYATDLGPISLKWARLGHNVGVQDGLDIKVNVG